MPPFFDHHGEPTISPFEVLNLPSTATETEIKKAYRSSMLQLHPDKLSPSLSAPEISAITEKFYNVKDAYEFLISPQYLTARRLYQAKIASRRAEYERREAFLRRAGVASGLSGTHSTRSRMTTADPPIHPRSNVSSYKMKSRGDPRHVNGSSTTRTRTGYTSDSYRAAKGGPEYAPHRNRTQQRRQEGDRKADQNLRSRARSEQPRSSRNPKAKENESGGSGSTDDRTYFEERRERVPPPPPKRKSTSPKNADGGSGDSGGNGGMDDPIKFEERKERNPPLKRKSSSTRVKNGTINNSRLDRRSINTKDRSRARSAPARCSDEPRRESTQTHTKSEKIPKDFYCPLTKRVMKDPVVDPEGNTYEREAIERWLRVQSSSPITNGHLSVEMLRPNKDLKNLIYKVVGRPRSRSQPRAYSSFKTSSSTNRSSSNQQGYVSGRVLIDSYLREISSKSKLSVSLDGMGICAFSYRKINFVIEVPSVPNGGFMVYSSFNSGSDDRAKLSGKIEAWNKWLFNVGRASRVSHILMGTKTVFCLRGSERDLSACDVFQKTLEFFVEMSLKLHNILYPEKVKSSSNVCLTKAAVCVS